jgi:hypothetical protein
MGYTLHVIANAIDNMSMSEGPIIILALDYGVSDSDITDECRVLVGFRDLLVVSGRAIDECVLRFIEVTDVEGEWLGVTDIVDVVAHTWVPDE